MATKFIAAAGSNYTDADAAVLGPELSRIAREYDNPTNDTLVELARDARSPLHAYIFKHDDDEAVKRFRVREAGDLVRAILVEFEDSTGKTRTARAFEYIEIVSAPAEGGDEEEEAAEEPTCRPSHGRRRRKRRIATIEQVVSNADASAEVIANAEMQLAAFKAKYDGYMALYPNFERRFRRFWTELQALLAAQPARPARSRGGRRPAVT